MISPLKFMFVRARRKIDRGCNRIEKQDAFVTQTQDMEAVGCVNKIDFRPVKRLHCLTKYDSPLFFYLFKATAWNMDFSRSVVVTMDFGRDYLSSSDRPINIQSYQTADRLSDHVSLVEKDEVSYGLAWMVKDRVQGDFLKDWPPKLKTRQDQASLSM